MISSRGFDLRQCQPKPDQLGEIGRAYASDRIPTWLRREPVRVAAWIVPGGDVVECFHEERSIYLHCKPSQVDSHCVSKP